MQWLDFSRTEASGYLIAMTASPYVHQNYQQNYSSNIEASVIQRRPNVVRVPNVQLGYASSFRVSGQTIALTASPYVAQVNPQMNYTAESSYVRNETVQSTHLSFGHRWQSESSGQRDTYQYQRVNYSSLAAYGLEPSPSPSIYHITSWQTPQLHHSPYGSTIRPTFNIPNQRTMVTAQDN